MPNQITFNLPIEYYDSIKISNPFFKSIFEFENALKLTIDSFLSVCYDVNWWEIKLRHKRVVIYDYVEDIKKRKSYMPMLGDTTKLNVKNIHLVTLGQLEEIVRAFQSDCIPELFPTIDFLTGHLLIIKKVRNLFAHMYPCITAHDIVVAKNEIYTLSSHLKHKYEYYVNG